MERAQRPRGRAGPNSTPSGQPLGPTDRESLMQVPGSPGRSPGRDRHATRDELSSDEGGVAEETTGLVVHGRIPALGLAARVELIAVNDEPHFDSFALPERQLLAEN